MVVNETLFISEQIMEHILETLLLTVTNLAPS